MDSQAELTTRGSLMRILRKVPTENLPAIYRVAKTRLRVFFNDPHAMRLLRDEMVARGLAEQTRNPRR